MKIVIVEDDHLQAQDLQAALRREFEAGFEVELVRTEHSFYSRLDLWAVEPPALFILDAMVRWTDPAPPDEMPPMPDDVREGGFYRAGIRCWRRLTAQPILQEVPVILFTILNGKDLAMELGAAYSSSNLTHVRKEASFAPILQAIRERLTGSQSTVDRGAEA